MFIYWLYQLFWVFLPPFIKLRLHLKARHNKAYLTHWEERFGAPHPHPVKNCLWIHAVSVGETQAAEPIIRLWREANPACPILLTQMTPSGRAAAERLFPFAQCRYLPYDKKSYCRRFLAEHEPIAALFMETEIWPNWLIALKEKSIPTFLVNARLSEKSYRGYAKVLSLSTLAIRSFTKIYAQSRADAANFTRLGARSIEVVGNTKYDSPLKPEVETLAACFRQNITPKNRQIVVCGSTRIKDGVNEAFLLLDEWAKHRPEALLIIVPRHPEAFDAVFHYARKIGLKAVRRSSAPRVNAQVDVVIGDSMGELSSYYALADVAFVGGSLVATGGQNIIEPLRLKIPTIFGFSTFNFAEVCADALSAGCALQVPDVKTWFSETAKLLSDPALAEKMRDKAAGFISAHQGASRKIVTEIAAFLS